MDPLMPIPSPGYPGLTDEEVQQRRNAGKTNALPDGGTQSISDIVKKNVFTYFNLIFAIIAVLLIIAGSFKNLTFLPVVIANTVIGIVQQVRSKKVLDELSLLSKATCKAIRGGVEKNVPTDALVLDDLVLLGEGQQIPADAVVIDGRVSVNESLLTGEADEIEKNAGDELKSGSFVVNGSCRAKLTHVGKNSYAARLTAKAKQMEEKPSEIIRGIELIIKVAGIAIIPIGLTLFIEALALNHKPFAEAITSTVGAVIGMIPEGLYLLVTIALALGAMRLAKQQILLHDMRSIETLAGVDVLCVDKTGTITDNKMLVKEVFAPEGLSEDGLKRNERLLAQYVATVTDGNATMKALRAYCPEATPLQTLAIAPFTSKTKYSEIRTAAGVYRLGAPEILLEPSTFERNRALIETRAAAGQRVLALVTVLERTAPLLFVALENSIRQNAADTFAFFGEQGVQIKVISGDNPLTVSRIAAQVNIADADKYVDATTLRDENAIREAVGEYTVFGRVKPEQKKAIIRALKESGKRVAMTGDGVNDILAMKEADCSIAMGAGSDAARQAAQVVLLDSDFSKMRPIVAQGRQIINNITRSATLFLYKNMFSMFLAAFSIITAFSYPLKPSQVSLVSGFNIGVPAFLLSLEPNIRKQEGQFLKRVLLTALPASLTSFFSIAAMVVFGNVFQISEVDVGVASTYLLAVVGFLILRNVSKPMNLYRTVVIVGCIVGFVVCACVPMLRSLFMIDEFGAKGIMLCVVFVIAEANVMRYITFLFNKAPEFVLQKRAQWAAKQQTL
jgi:cation-transporting ATPase E